MTQILSASQISTAELCLRKWAWLKIAKLEPPPSRYAKMGQDVHKLLEDWFRDSVPPWDGREGEMAQAILKHLPPPQTDGLEVERYFTHRIGGVLFRGYIDLAEPGRGLVADHKTTSDLRWAKSAEDLIHDPQATLYADWAMTEWGRDRVRLQWTYATRQNPPKSMVTSCTVTKSDIAPRIAQTERTGRVLLQLYEDQPDPLDVDYDARGCGAFGGCPFRSQCNLSPAEEMKSLMSQSRKAKSFAESLRKGRGIVPPPIEDPKPKDTDTVPAPPPDTEVKSDAPLASMPFEAPDGVLAAYRRGFQDGYKTGWSDAKK